MTMVFGRIDLAKNVVVRRRAPMAWIRAQARTTGRGSSRGVWLHGVRLIAPKFVRPHRMTSNAGQNDAAAAAAACEAIQCPHTRFVPAKSLMQADDARARQGFVE